MMKKSFLLCALLAGIAVMTGCKKDQDFVTLKAVIDPGQNTKAYFGTPVRPYWDTDDQVCVMGTGYSKPQNCYLGDVNQTYATILEVPSSGDNGYYCAIYPVKAAYKMGIPSNNGTTQAVICYPSIQKYIWDEKNERQRINMPMGAVTSDAQRTFYFKNLCSILRLNVINNGIVEFHYDKWGTLIDTAHVACTTKVRRVSVQANGAYVAGAASVILTPDSATVTMDGPALPDTCTNVLTLYDDNRFMKTLAPGDSASFDVVVPPFHASSLNLELELFDKDGKFLGNSDYIIDNPPAVGLNEIVTFALKTNDGFEKPDYAYLAEGPKFDSLMHVLIGTNNVKAIDFEFYNATGIPPENYSQENLDTSTRYPGWIIVSADDSPMKIFAHIGTSQGQTAVVIMTHANYMYCQPNSRGMFKDLTTVSHIRWDIDPTSGMGFQTEDVTDMSYMFAGCTSLTTVEGIEYSDFTNVENMAHIFDSCIALQSFAFHPNTHNLRDTGMVAMFKDCRLLQDLTLSSPFTVGRITTMRDLFRHCGIGNGAGGGLFLNNFVIPEGTDLSGMFVYAGKFSTYNIHCSDDVYEILNQQGPGVIDLDAAIFVNQQSQSK